jgi:hypothetical protein
MSAPRQPALRYAVTFTNAKGLQRRAVVELAPEEVLDMLFNSIDGRSAGHVDGPISKTYAANRAVAEMPDMPPEFIHKFPDVRRVVVH